MKLNKDEVALLFYSRPMRTSDIPPAWRDGLLSHFGLGRDEAGEATLQERLDDINDRLHRELNKGGGPDV